MGKRGIRQPWRVTYTWPHPYEQPYGKPVRGVETFASRDAAESLISRLKLRSNKILIPIHITVEHRELPETRVVIDHTPIPQES